MPPKETFEQQVIKLLKLILKRLDEIEQQMPTRGDYPQPPGQD